MWAGGCKSVGYRKYHQMNNVRVRLQCFTHYCGGAIRCVCPGCKETNPDFLTIDHMDGGGNQHRKALKKNGVNFYKWLKSQGWPPGYQVLCQNCNSGRARNGGICPHVVPNDYSKLDLSHSVNQYRNPVGIRHLPLRKGVKKWQVRYRRKTIGYCETEAEAKLMYQNVKDS